MDNLNRDFLGKFAQKGIDICEPEEGFDKYPQGLKHCINDLIKNHLGLQHRIKQLEDAIEEIETESQKLIELLEEDGEREYIDFVQNIEEIAQKALEGGK